MLMPGLLLCSFLLHAQKNYAIKISDAKTGNGIINAAVKIKSTNKTIITNASGTVVIFALETDVLQISSHGYTRREIALAGQSIAIDVIMEPLVIKQKHLRKRN